MTDQTYTVVDATPLLQMQGAGGRTNFWQAEILHGQDGHYYLMTSWYSTLASGTTTELQRSVPVRIQGVNIGRSNETTPEQQARLQLASTMQGQLDQGYHEEGQEATIRILPMLAHGWTPDKTSYPLYVQPKFDGCRALFDGKEMWSRGGKPFIPEVVRHLTCFYTEGLILDGELMLPHEDYTFQQTMSAIKRHRPESEYLGYYVYDCFLPDAPAADFEARFAMLRDLVERHAPGSVQIAQTEQVDDRAELDRWHEYFTGQLGYEGSILRTPGGHYAVNARSGDLRKRKDFQDAEYEIINVGEGVGKFEGVIMFTCRTPQGKVFQCNYAGSLEDRRAMYQQREKYRSHLLTVRFQNLTDDGIPRFPVGYSLRDPEVQG